MSKVIETETGTATVHDDGSMTLENSGYERHLTKEMVDIVKSGAPELPADQEEIDTVISEGGDLGDAFHPHFDGEYWDFGDDIHEIPLD